MLRNFKFRFRRNDSYLESLKLAGIAVWRAPEAFLASNLEDAVDIVRGLVGLTVGTAVFLGGRVALVAAGVTGYLDFDRIGEDVSRETPQQ